MPEETHYCRDCFFARNKYSPENEWQCLSSENMWPEISLVTGTNILKESALNNRLIIDACGPEGKWFKSHQQYIAENSHYLSSSQKKPQPINLDDL